MLVDNRKQLILHRNRHESIDRLLETAASMVGVVYVRWPLVFLLFQRRDRCLRCGDARYIYQPAIRVCDVTM